MLTKFQTAFYALLRAVDEGDTLPHSVIDVLERGTPLVERVGGGRIQLSAEGERALFELRREVVRELTTLGGCADAPVLRYAGAAPTR